MSTSQSLPLYQCHKQVRAIKIKEVLKHAHPDPKADDAAFESSPAFQGAHLIPIDERFLPIAVDADWYRKHSPKPGGYYVLYEDGYASYSPAAAFENSCSPVLAMAQQNSRVESAGAMVGASASISGQQRMSHREELERLLASGASAQIAHNPENAAAIAKGIKVVLDELAPVAPHPAAVATPSVLDPGTAYIESEIQANSHHIGCKGKRCMASAANGYAHSRECIDEAGEAQGWKPTAEDYAKCGPSAECCGAAPTDSHASAVLYPAIERAMSELGTLHPAFNFAVNRAFNHLHDAFWSECPAPASAAPKRPEFPGV